MTHEIRSMEELQAYLTKEFPQFQWQLNYDADGMMATNKDNFRIDVVPQVFGSFEVDVMINVRTCFSVRRAGSNLKEVVAAVCERIQHEVNKLESVIKDLGG